MTGTSDIYEKRMTRWMLFGSLRGLAPW